MTATADGPREALASDEILEQIVDFSADVTFDDLTPLAIEAAKTRIVDSLGCAVGAWGCENAEIGRRLAPQPVSAERAGRVIGNRDRVAAESAAFVNGCLIRDLDFNDTYPGGHPSDSLGGLLAVAPQTGANGRDLIVATVISYEIFIRLQMAGQLREKGWDNGFGIGVGTAAAVARLMRLTREQMRHAISLTATANVPMRASRAGNLSMWKGAATAFSTRAAVAATQLAAEGMTGPEAPFSGRHGLVDLITGPLSLDPFGTAGGEFHIHRAKIKYWPVVYNMQALVWAARELREQLEGREPEAIEVQTYWSAWHESGSEEAKWDPRTRETADHSLPYILAWTLRHGRVDHAAFQPESYLDESFRPVMQKVTVTVDDEIEAEFPRTVRMRMLATDLEGRNYRVEITNPLGHEDNPVSGRDIDDKFRRLCTPRLGEEPTEQALQRWWAIDEEQIDAALDLLVIPGA